MPVRLLTSSRTMHKRLTAALARTYEEEVYGVQADEIGHPNGAPPLVNGHQPDVAGYRNRQLVRIGEAETADSLNDDHTRQQWQAFSRSPYWFDVIVPESCLFTARMRAAAWSVHVSRFYHLPGC